VEVKAEESASVTNVSVCQDQSTRDLHVKIVRYEISLYYYIIVKMSVLGVQHLKLALVGSSPDQVKPKTIKLVFVASMLARSIKENEQRLAGFSMR
jgi:hypothetical protein